MSNEREQLHPHLADCLACCTQISVCVPHVEGSAVDTNCPACGAMRRFGVAYDDEFGFHAEDWTFDDATHHIYQIDSAKLEAATAIVNRAFPVPQAEIRSYLCDEWTYGDGMGQQQMFLDEASPLVLAHYFVNSRLSLLYIN